LNWQAVCQRLDIDPATILPAISKDLADLGFPPRFEIVGLPGGASNRGYMRVNFKAQAPAQSIIVMVLRDPDFKQAIEEVVEKGFEIKELPFLNVLKHFQAAGVTVPALIHYNQAKGLIYIEDLGDTLLRDAILAADQSGRQRLLKAAIDELVLLQLDAGVREDRNFIGFRVRFSRELLRWELDHFKEWALDKRLGPVLKESESKMLDASFEKITEELLASPYILSHRDYHIDNLMVKDDKIRILDFQDALMAPYTYDLASLLYDRDTSQIIGPGLIEEMVKYYFDRLARGGCQPQEFSAYRRLFDLCVLHRAFKVVGRFYFLAGEKKKPEYLNFLPSVYSVLSQYLNRFNELAALKKMLAQYLAELE